MSWERLGMADEVDTKLLCPDIYVDETSFYCGFIKNMYLENQEKLSENTEHIIYPKLDQTDMMKTFCVNVSDCFIPLPYLCEVNCTNQVILNHF